MSNYSPPPLTGTCFRCQISNLRQYRTAATLKVIVGQIPVVRPVAKPFWSPLLERYWPEAEHLSNGLGSPRVSELHRWPIFLAAEDHQGGWSWGCAASAAGAKSTSRTA